MNFFRTEHKPSRRWRMGRPPQRPALRLETLEERVVPSSASNVRDLGTIAASFNSTGADTLVIPLRTAQASNGSVAAAEDTIIVEVGVSLVQDNSNPPALSVTVTDDAGNAYSKDVDSKPIAGGGPGILIFSAHNIHPLGPNQALTVHLDGGPRLEAASANVFGGLFLGPILDKGESNGGYDPSGTASVTSGVSPTAQQDELVIGAFAAAVSGSAPAAFAAGSGLQSLPGATVSAQIASFASPSSLSLNAEFGNVTAAQFHATNATYTAAAGQNIVWGAGSVAYLAVPQTITSVSPLWITAGGPDFTLTVNGNDFASNSVVQWYGQPLTTTFVSTSRLQASVPSNLIAGEGPADITVFTPGSGTTNVKGFIVLPREKLSAPLIGPATTVFDVTADGSLYRHDAAGWTQIGGKGSIEGISATEVQAGTITLFAVTTDHALFAYTASGGWHQIGAKNTVVYASAGLDENGNADVWVLTGDLSLTRYSDSGGWLPSPVGAPDTVANVHADQTGGVNVVTSDGRTSFYGMLQTLFPLAFPDTTTGLPITPAWRTSSDQPYSYLDYQSIALGMGARGPMSNTFALQPDGTLWLSNAGPESATSTAAHGVLSVRTDLRQGYWLTGRVSVSAGIFGEDAMALPAIELFEENAGGTIAPLHAPRWVEDFIGASQNQLYAAMTDGSVWQHDDTTGWIQLKGLPAS